MLCHLSKTSRNASDAFDGRSPKRAFRGSTKNAHSRIRGWTILVPSTSPLDEVPKNVGVPITCMTTRAVHIQIVLKLDTSSCVMGIERFAARRGHPHTIWSDNGTNFVGADKELALCFANLDPDKVAQTSASKGIKWKFNPAVSTPSRRGLGAPCSELYASLLQNTGKSKAYGRSAENYVLLG